MLGLHDIQYLYEFIFWLVTFFILKKVWHKPKIRLFYGYSVATLNVVAVFFFSLACSRGDAQFRCLFLWFLTRHGCGCNALTLVHQSQKLEALKASEN